MELLGSGHRSEEKHRLESNYNLEEFNLVERCPRSLVHFTKLSQSAANDYNDDVVVSKRTPWSPSLASLSSLPNEFVILYHEFTGDFSLYIFPRSRRNYRYFRKKKASVKILWQNTCWNENWKSFYYEKPFDCYTVESVGQISWHFSFWKRNNYLLQDRDID